MVEKLEGNVKSTVREKHERNNNVREATRVTDARTPLNTAHKETVVLKEGVNPAVVTNKEIPAQPKQSSVATALPNNPATPQKPSASVFTNVVAPQPDAVLAQ